MSKTPTNDALVPDPSSEVSTIPRFAVVGRVNKGKSSILATLVEEADNTKIRISDTPGETTRVYSIPLVLQGQTLLEFLDTPGFNRARKALDWLQKRHRKSPDEPRIEAVRAFVEAHRNKDAFQDEVLLLEPVLDGAGILYVVDASKPFRPDFTAEMEILRWTGRPRMAVINQVTETSDFSDEWRQHLGEYFNLTREFNAHHARFQERIRLLKSLLEIDETARKRIEKTVQMLEREWTQRRGKCSDVIMDMVEACMTHRASKTLSQEDSTRDYRKQEIAEQLKVEYLKAIQEMESAYHKQMLSLYRHNEYEVTSDDSFTRAAGDLDSKETWEVFGLNKAQLSMASAAAGAITGGAIDMGVGGASFGVGAVLGGLAGLSASLLKGKDLADIKVSSPLVGDMAAGGIAIKAGPPKNPNFPWVLLDRAFVHFEQLISRAHARRDPFIVDLTTVSKEGVRIGRSTTFPNSKRRPLVKWFGELKAGKSRPETSQAFEVIRETLETIETEVLKRPELDT
tara:strand:- start:11147 stop:12685 length:1539 start_codon:yes stop_codon:yes gene_type:complete